MTVYLVVSEEIKETVMIVANDGLHMVYSPVSCVQLQTAMHITGLEECWLMYLYMYI